MKITRRSMSGVPVPVISLAARLRNKREDVASSEPEDAALTGMTRSLDRRLLALNLRPVASAKWQGLKAKIA